MTRAKSLRNSSRHGSDFDFSSTYRAESPGLYNSSAKRVRTPISLLTPLLKTSLDRRSKKLGSLFRYPTAILCDPVSVFHGGLP
jgi:hypothetical protein